MWYDCQSDDSPPENQMTQKLATLGHRMAFDNEQNPYNNQHAIKGLAMTNVKQFKQEKLRASLHYKTLQ